MPKLTGVSPRSVRFTAIRCAASPPSMSLEALLEFNPTVFDETAA
jgi:hypothetical protein